MRRPFSIVALFCEDIREEKSGQDTLVGILPDNLVVGTLPGILPKLGVYFRIQLEREDSPQTMKVRVKILRVPAVEMSLDHVIDAAKQYAEQEALPFASILAKSIISPVPIQASGKIEATAEIDGVEYICGMLSVHQSTTMPFAPPD